ncbi:hypothetical protein V8E51_018525 [Hyaloscypha variabilis]
MPNSTAVDAAFALGAALNYTCPIQGNSDLYGLGIRIGLYLQIFTAQISGLASHVLEVDDNIGHEVVVFILATGAVLFRLILKQRIEAAEVFPILSLLIVQLGACRVPFWKKPMTVTIYLGEVICLLSLTTWFWFHGMDTLPRSCRDDYAFFFKKVSIWHWFRKFSQAGTVMAILAGGGGALVYILMLPALVIANFSEWTKGWRNEEHREEGEHPDMGTGKFEIAFELGIVVYVEMSLKWNNIIGVHSLSQPGQFMPFFIALAELVTTLYRVGKYAVIHAIEEDHGGPEGDDNDCPHKRKHDENDVKLDDIKSSTAKKDDKTGTGVTSSIV